MNKGVLQLCPMRHSDIAFGMKLKAKAGWNQLPSDWELLLNLSPGGSYVAHYDGHKAGTVTTIHYEWAFSWIGMVLVEPEYRGLGIGSGLLKAAIDFAQPRGPVLLDATPKGRKLYLTLGFEEVCHLERLELARAPVFPSSANRGIFPLHDPSFFFVIRYDAASFGGQRAALLHHFHRCAPKYSFIAMRAGKVAGYCLGRHGSRFEQIGPLVADDFATARVLFETVVGQCNEKPVVVDVMREQQEWYAYLLDSGFKVQRPFIRMKLGKGTASPDRSRQYAIAGPEFG